MLGRDRRRRADDRRRPCRAPRFVDHDDWTELRFAPAEQALMTSSAPPSPGSATPTFTAAAPQRPGPGPRGRAAAAIDDAGLDRRRRRRHRQLHGDARLGAHARRSPPRSACRELRFSLDVDLGGQAPCHLVAQAAAAVDDRAGRRTCWSSGRMNGRSGPRVGTMQFPGAGRPVPLPDRLRRLPHVRRRCGRQRFLHETGQGERGPGRGRRRPAGATPATTSAPSGAGRSTCERVPRRAVRGRSVPGRRLHDRGRRCLRGARHVARAGPRPAPPAGRRRRRRLPRRAAPGPRHRRPPALGRLHPQLHQPGCATSCSAGPALAPADVQFAEIYDCFTSTVLMGLEGLGLCGRGESGALVRSGATATRRPAADQHPRRPARRGLPARHEHRRRGGAADPGPRRRPPGAPPRGRAS